MYRQWNFFCSAVFYVVFSAYSSFSHPNTSSDDEDYPYEKIKDSSQIFQSNSLAIEREKRQPDSNSISHNNGPQALASFMENEAVYKDGQENCEMFSSLLDEALKKSGISSLNDFQEQYRQSSEPEKKELLRKLLCWCLDPIEKWQKQNPLERDSYKAILAKILGVDYWILHGVMRRKKPLVNQLVAHEMKQKIQIILEDALKGAGLSLDAFKETYFQMEPPQRRELIKKILTPDCMQTIKNIAGSKKYAPSVANVLGMDKLDEEMVREIFHYKPKEKVASKQEEERRKSLSSIIQKALVDAEYGSPEEFQSLYQELEDEEEQCRENKRRRGCNIREIKKNKVALLRGVLKRDIFIIQKDYLPQMGASCSRTIAAALGLEGNAHNVIRFILKRKGEGVCMKTEDSYLSEEDNENQSESLHQRKDIAKSLKELNEERVQTILLNVFEKNGSSVEEFKDEFQQLKSEEEKKRKIKKLLSLCTGEIRACLEGSRNDKRYSMILAEALGVRSEFVRWALNQMTQTINSNTIRTKRYQKVHEILMKALKSQGKTVEEFKAVYEGSAKKEQGELIKTLLKPHIDEIRGYFNGNGSSFTDIIADVLMVEASQVKYIIKHLRPRDIRPNEDPVMLEEAGSEREFSEENSEEEPSYGEPWRCLDQSVPYEHNQEEDARSDSYEEGVDEIYEDESEREVFKEELKPNGTVMAEVIAEEREVLRANPLSVKNPCPREPYAENEKLLAQVAYYERTGIVFESLREARQDNLLYSRRGLLFFWQWLFHAS